MKTFKRRELRIKKHHDNQVWKKTIQEEINEIDETINSDEGRASGEKSKSGVAVVESD